MIILGVDFGLKKIGLALSEKTLAYPIKVIRYDREIDAVSEIKKVIELEKVEKIVFGISEGKMERLTKEFAYLTHKETGLPIEFQDETLTTKDAQTLSIQAGIKRGKRHKFEDAYAASLMLQGYLDLNM